MVLGGPVFVFKLMVLFYEKNKKTKENKPSFKKQI